jgi:phosphoenolpyruvate carboxykinase (ATP)
MELTASRTPIAALKNMGIKNSQVFYQFSHELLTEQTLVRGLGELNEKGALCVHTGKFTGRSPQDKFIVKDRITANRVNWNNFNQPISEDYFLKLKAKMTAHLSAVPEIWVRDSVACAHPDYQLRIRVVNEDPWSNLFAHNMFLRPEHADANQFEPDWHILHAPSFEAYPVVDGTRNPHFAIISFPHKTILIGGTGYTGEMKKGIFTVLNFLMPLEYNALSMHCSANKAPNGDTAVFFGLSGTGKTTLSAGADRELIGDDEHAWTEEGIFNFEGGCYAKCIGLTPEKEPEIFQAIRPGALLENTVFFNGSNEVNYRDGSITENTRVSYPLHYINNAAIPSVGNHPKHIFFLTCDANAVLPPISRLSKEQAMYQFISGYTAKVAGTENGITEPTSTFSACFGAPFMPLHPGHYASMLGNKMNQHNVKVWLVNTGWIEGPYGIGKRISLKYTRALIAAALNNELDEVSYSKEPVFGFDIPDHCPGVPDELLNPVNTWENKELYREKAVMLAKQFINNFKKFELGVSADILSAAPIIPVS